MILQCSKFLYKNLDILNNDVYLYKYNLTAD